jgi:predicted N-acyltransferase
MDFEIQIVHGVEDVGKDAWDKLSTDRPFQSYQWYSFAEKVMKDSGCQPSYIILSTNGWPVARASFWLIPNEPLPIHGIARSVLGKAFQRWPLFICRSPFSGSSGLILPELPLMESALSSIAQVATEQARNFHASCVLFDFLEREVYEKYAWPAGALGLSVGDPGTKMDISWPEFDSYLRSMSPKSRKNYRQHCRNAENRKIRIQIYSEPPSLEDVEPLWRNVETKFHESRNPWNKYLLKHFPMVKGSFISAVENDKLVGCGLFLGDRQELVATGLGLDYNSKNIYSLLNYSAIRAAIEAKLRVLHWGSGAYEVKGKLGFKVENTNYVVYIGIGRVSKLLGRLVAWWMK